jgi:glycosyltransferase involved in cell wall biosynthesis
VIEVTSPISIPLVSVVLTYNEERNLPDCLKSIAGWVDEIVVVDSGSTDHTREIAAGYGAGIMVHSFETHAKQWGWVLENLPPHCEWVLALDADQRVTSELRNELLQLFTVDQERLKDWDGFYVKRRQIFRGRWIRYGGYYPKYLLKVFRRSKVLMDIQDLGQHHFYVSGNVTKLVSDLIEDNHKEADIAFWIEKHNRYALLQAKEELLRKQNGLSWPIPPSLFGSPDQRIIWLRLRWYGLPLYLRPFLYFFYRYFLRFGFLDGKQGFIFHFLHSYWYPLLTDIHLEELRRE